MLRLLSIAGGIVLAVAASGSPTEGSSTPPPDCFVSGGATAGGPASPLELQQEGVPVWGDPFLPWNIDVSWVDNSADENCFVLERGVNDAAFETIAYLPANTESFRDERDFEDQTVRYRVYAANAVARSEYSNESGDYYPWIDPTPSPTPSPSPTPLYQRGDLNCDGSIDAADALSLLREDAGFDPNLPPRCPSLDSEVHIHASAAVGAGVALGAIGLIAGRLLYVRRKQDEDPL